jgi:hypothetical protein
MSSIQGFLRQRNVANSLLQAPTTAGCYYNFVAGSGNYVGNYPPGYMVAASEDIAAAASAQSLLIRDMGKTIKAPIGTGVTATEGFFREVQLIRPVAAVSATGSTTFGVGAGVAGSAAGTVPAGNAGFNGYGTFYIAIVIDGTLATSDGSTTAVLPSPYLPLGGQM